MLRFTCFSKLKSSTILNLLLFAILISFTVGELSEQELQDTEDELTFRFNQIHKENKQSEDKEMCGEEEKNKKAEDWKKINKYCLNYAANSTTCKSCLKSFLEANDFCTKKIPFKDGCDQVQMNKKGSCFMEYYEDHRYDFLQLYHNNKEGYLSFIKNVRDCYLKFKKAKDLNDLKY